MGDLFALVLTVLLIAANAFFVGAEFALISARRDRLEREVAWWPWPLRLPAWVAKPWPSPVMSRMMTR